MLPSWNCFSISSDFSLNSNQVIVKLINCGHFIAFKAIYDQTLSSLIKIIKLWSNLSRFVKTCQTLLRLIRTCQNWWNDVNSDQTCQILISKFVKTCYNWSNHVKNHVSSFEMKERIVTFCAPMKTERLFSLVVFVNNKKPLVLQFELILVNI